jgi:hypothetical protein
VPDLETLVDRIVEIAAQHMKNDGFVTSVTFFSTTVNELGLPEKGCLFLPWDPRLSKDEMRFAQDRIIERTQADIIINVMESWAVKIDEKELDVRRPSQHPERKEIVVVYGEAREGKTISMYIPIIRDGDSSRLALDQKERCLDHAVGRFANYFGRQAEA